MANAIETADVPLDAASLLDRARAAAERAYAPYSGFRVGAALLDAAGVVHTGSNVENASYGMTMCAERVAVANAVANGVRSFAAIAIAGPDGSGALLPCGACRQVLHEFAPGMEIVVAGDSDPRIVSLRDLLPDPFDAADLSPAREGGDG